MQDISVLQTDLAYWAGLVDGEGTITIRRSKPNGSQRSPNYRLTTRITNTNRRILEKAKEFFGYGCIITRKDKRQNRKTCYHWEVDCYRAFNVLKQICPYLNIKIYQALLGIAFHSSIGKRTGCKPLLPSTIQKRERFFQLMKKINHRGV